MRFYCNGKKGICTEAGCEECESYKGTGGKWVKTNADYIRAMGDEELAWLLFEFRFDAYGKATGNEGALPDTQKKIIEWLQQPVEIEPGKQGE